MKFMKRLIAVWIGSVFIASLLVTPLSAAEKKEPSPDEVAADLLFVRPVAFSAVIVGSAIYIISLPFTIPTGNAKLAGRKLVVKPWKYTFSKPLGELETPF
jgi:hypothetical protein